MNVHCEICAYSRFCETKELKGENNSVLHSLFSLPPTTYWWASSCILGNQWLKRFHRVSAWLRVIWQIYELCWTGSKCPENNRHSARCSLSTSKVAIAKFNWYGGKNDGENFTSYDRVFHIYQDCTYRPLNRVDTTLSIPWTWYCPFRAMNCLTN